MVPRRERIVRSDGRGSIIVVEVLTGEASPVALSSDLLADLTHGASAAEIGSASVSAVCCTFGMALYTLHMDLDLFGRRRLTSL
jgi:hypothetical protein